MFRVNQKQNYVQHPQQNYYLESKYLLFNNGDLKHVHRRSVMLFWGHPFSTYAKVSEKLT